MDFAKVTDEMLLRRTPIDVDAFGELYRRHERTVLVYFLRRTSTADVAADLSAETFAAALESAARFRGEGSALGWLFAIAHNVLVSSYRRARVQDDARQRLGIAELTITDEIAEVLERMQRQAAGSEAMELFRDLPEHEREAIAAHVLEEQGYHEIATALRCSQSLVRKRVSRGLGSLRVQLPNPS